jgi:hypothetical protein
MFGAPSRSRSLRDLRFPSDDGAPNIPAPALCAESQWADMLFGKPYLCC